MSTQLDMFAAEPSTGSLVGIKVKLDRDIARQKPCCENVTTLRPGKARQAAELRCASCGSHRGWLPRAALDFLTTTSTRFGAPAEPIVLRDSTIGDHVMEKKFDNSGLLFRNNYKEGERDRDYSGSITIEGREFWLSGWIKEGKKGKFLSLSAKPKNADTAKPKQSLGEELNDSVDF